jgi:predicted O-methyltransferase YrrM
MVNLRTSFKEYCLRIVDKSSLLIALLRLYRRKRIVNSYLGHTRRVSRRWITSKTEDSNFYYGLEDENRHQLIHFVATILRIDHLEISRYFEEIGRNEYLTKVMKGYFNKHQLRDALPEIGRRLAWYALIRHVKPGLVIETGVHHGVGGLVICLALQANEAEGFVGKYIGVDIDPRSGELLDTEVFKFARIVVSDSHKFLTDLSLTCDFFIHDSDHSKDFELQEYYLIHDKLSDQGIILSDNSHATAALREFSEDRDRAFYYFREAPKNHWYPGAGLGVSMCNPV